MMQGQFISALDLLELLLLVWLWYPGYILADTTDFSRKL